MIIVSACLAGIKCRYNSTSASNNKVIELVKKRKAIPICPEQLGGLPTPRPAAERVGSKVLDENGKDYTKEFKKGAWEALRIAKLTGCKKAILKAKSPSCGYGQIYNGTFSGKLIKGDGIFASLLKRNKIKTTSL